MSPNTRVMVDLTFFTGSRGGMETYVREIYSAMAADGTGMDFAAVVNRGAGPEDLEWFPGPLLRVPLSGGRVSWAVAEVAAVGPIARRWRADVLHCPANFGPLFRWLPTVVTIHDLLAFRHPELTGSSAQAISRLTAGAARAATRIITISQSSAADIERFLRIPSDRVDMIPNAAAPPRHLVPAGSLPAGVSGGRRIVLSAGNRLPHKNFDLLVRAWAHIPKAIRPLLVITGGPGESDPLWPTIRDLGLDDDVVALGWITRDELDALYAAAWLYICPSLFEGFGLPILEAMQRGCPVLAADLPVLREVGADAVLYMDPTNAQSMARSVADLIDEPAMLAQKASTALARAQTFSWAKSAELTAASLRAAAGRGSTT